MWAIKDSGVYFALVTGDSDMKNGPKMTSLPIVRYSSGRVEKIQR